MIDGSENINLISCHFQLICYVNDSVEVQNMGEVGKDGHDFVIIF